MPELPEVEIVKRSLSKMVNNAKDSLSIYDWKNIKKEWLSVL